MRIAEISIGFIEVPNQISLNVYCQGCSRNCYGCANPEYQAFEGGQDISLEFMKDILNKHELPTWICFLGGDCCYQPDELKIFSKYFKEVGYKVALYTGFYFEQIKNLLEYVDLVVDGPYEEEYGPIESENTRQRVFLKVNNNWKQVKFFELNKLLEV